MSTEENGNTTIDPSTMVTTPGGEQVSLAELTSGYMRQSDYTKKTQELSEQSKDAQEAITFRQTMNTYFAEKPDAYQDVKHFAETGEIQKVTSNDEETPTSTKKEASDPFQQQFDSYKIEASEREKGLIAELQNLKTQVAGFSVDKATANLKKQFDIKDEDVVKQVLARASNNYNQNKDFDGNLVDAYKVVAFDDHVAEQEEIARKKATSIPTTTGEGGEKRQLTDNEMFTKNIIEAGRGTGVEGYTG